jgi:hypothetical protein
MLFTFKYIPIFTVVCCSFLTSSVHSQEKKQRVLLEIKLEDQKSSEPIVFANVINAKRNCWVISDTIGYARIAVFSGDTITITSLGYSITRYIISDSVLNGPKPTIIRLEVKKYEINRVNISFLGTYEDFKYKILHMNMPDKLLFVKNQIRFEKNKIATYPLNEQFGISINGAISALYDAFSKEGKSKRKLVEALQTEKIIRNADMKYQRDVVGRITGLKNLELDEFILKYRPAIDYLISSSEYDVIGRILMDYEKYKVDKDTLVIKK